MEKKVVKCRPLSCAVAVSCASAWLIAPGLAFAGGEFTSVNGIPANHIAAWQGCPDPGEPGIPGDLNGDGSVGVADLLILLSKWGQCADCGNCPADLTGDCNVGVADLLVLLGNWG